MNIRSLNANIMESDLCLMASLTSLFLSLNKGKENRKAKREDDKMVMKKWMERKFIYP